MNRTVQRSIEIMRLIADSSEGLSINELTEITSIPKTTLYDIVVTLEDLGMIISKTGTPRRYTIGLTAFLLGSRYIYAIDLIQVAKPYMNCLSEELNRTIFLAVPDGVNVLYIEKSQPKNAVYTTAEIFSRPDVYCTSLGKALLAFNENRDAILDQIVFKRHTARTITDKNSLLRDLERTRQRGYAIDNREIIEQVVCVGAPIFDRSGRVCAALSAAGLYDPVRDLDEEGSILRSAANEISKLLGHR